MKKQLVRHVIDSSGWRSHQADRRQGEDSGTRPRTRRHCWPDQQPSRICQRRRSPTQDPCRLVRLLTLTLLLAKEMTLASATSAKRGRRAGSVHRHVASVTSISRGRKTVQTDSPAPRTSGSLPSSKLELCASTLKMRQMERWTCRQGPFKTTTYPIRSWPRRRILLARLKPLEKIKTISQVEMALLNREDLLSSIMVAPSMAERLVPAIVGAA